MIYLPHQAVPSPSPEIRHARRFVHGTIECVHRKFPRQAAYAEAERGSARGDLATRQ